MKKLVKIVVALLLVTSTRGYSDPSTCDDAGWECCYPSAYSFNCFQGWCDNLRISGALLYWELSDEPYDFINVKKAIRDVLVEDDEFLHSAKQCNKHIGFGYDPGFRVGIGWTLPCCCCFDVDFFWTHYYVHGKKHLVINGATDPIFNSFVLIVEPTISGFVPSGERADFLAKAKFRYDVLDLEVGKWCCLCDCIRIRPFIGLRYVDIEDKSSVDFEFSSDFAECNALSGHVKTSNDFRGLGIRGGLGFEYDCCCCLSVFANFAGSFAWGNAHSGIATDTLVSGVDPISRTCGGGNAGRAFLDGELGLQYSTCICGCYPLLLALSWEQNYLFDFKRFQIDTESLSLTDASTGYWKRDDLFLSGLTFSVEVGF
jgi:hypothetical protein